MYLRDLWASFVRRWPLALVCLIITGSLVYGASHAVKATYRTESSVVLVPPVDGADPTQNRYLGLAGLKESSDVLSRSMMSDATVRDVRREVPHASYEVAEDPSASAPIVSIVAKGANRSVVMRTQAAVLKRLPTNLQRLQTAVGIEAKHQITLVTVSHDPKPSPVQRVRLRILGVLLVGLLMFSALIVAAADGLLLARSARAARTARTARADTTRPEADAEPDRQPDRQPEPSSSAAPDEGSREAEVAASRSRRVALDKARSQRKANRSPSRRTQPGRSRNRVSG